MNRGEVGGVELSGAWDEGNHVSTYVLHIHFPSIAISYGDFIGTDGRRNRTTGLHENICVLLQKPRLIPRSLACQLLGCNQTNCSNCNPHNTTIIQIQ